MSAEHRERLGIEVRWNTESIEKDGEMVLDERGYPVFEKTTIREVSFPLSPEEWCEIGMNEGEHYIGQCCAHTSAMQDMVSSIFRDGGWVRSWDFRALARLAIHHDGFEAFEDKNLLETTTALENLDPWARIGVVYQAVQDELALDTVFVHKDDVSAVEDALGILDKTLWNLRMARMFSTNHDDHDVEYGALRGAQRHANIQYNMLQALPAFRTVHNYLEETVADNPFHGFAVREKGSSEILTNMNGTCIFPSEDRAKELVELFREHDERHDDLEVAPVTVTVTNGLEWK
jgi:hypothetical protein